MTQKMLNAITHTYTLTLQTGLHIGGSKDGLKIGGIDSSVVKHPLTGAPYIPGSSIKGKMRALLEMVKHTGDLEYDKEGRIWSSTTGPVANAFGSAKEKIPSKLIFEDFMLTDEWNKKYIELKSDFFEDKAENSVPRFLSGSANPRHIERVPAGVQFIGKIILLPHEGEKAVSAEELEKLLQDGIELLESNYLGGGGSRGSGRITFEKVSEN